MFEDLLYSRLKTVAANVYPLAAPLNYKRPAVIYNRTATEPLRDINDDVEASAWVTFQIDVYSLTFSEAKAVSRAIRDSLKAWQDPDVQTLAYTGEQHMVDNTTEDQLYRVMVFYRAFVAD